MAQVDIANRFIYNIPMIVLLYYKDGFMRKFPLDKPLVLIGRDQDCDLVIDEPYVSRKHLEIEVNADRVLIRDLQSTNGTYFDGKAIESAELKIGDSFSFKGLDFFLQKGSLDEFAPAQELIPLLDTIRKKNRVMIEAIETRDEMDIFQTILSNMLEEGLKNQTIHQLLCQIAHLLQDHTSFGSMFIITNDNNQSDILFSLCRHQNAMDLYRRAITIPGLFDAPQSELVFPDKAKMKMTLYPFSLGHLQAAILYFPQITKEKQTDKINQFLIVLAKELEFLARLNRHGSPNTSVTAALGQTDIVCTDPVMKNLIRQTVKIAQSNVFVLIQGESGTGKELFAKLIHQNSKRKAKEFIAINCAAIPEHLLESELFGYEKGAFTGATVQKKGKLELASGGTLVLDEISEMPQSLQAKLLRALEENAFYRLGGLKPIQVDLRIVSLTNKNLNQLVNENGFREDLYYRLVHHTLTIPPLRERPGDIAQLINHFTHRFCHDLSIQIRGYTSQALNALQTFTWPGNVRQLKNEINRLVNLADEDEPIGIDLLSECIRSRDADRQITVATALHGSCDKERILALLDQHQGSRVKTARALGISTQALWKKMKKLGLGNRDS